MLGHHRHANETKLKLSRLSLIAFRWRADDDPLIVVVGSSLPSSSEKKMLSKLDPLWQNFLDPRIEVRLVPLYNYLETHNDISNKRREEGKDRESIQSSTKPNSENNMGK